MAIDKIGVYMCKLQGARAQCPIAGDQQIDVINCCRRGCRYQVQRAYEYDTLYTGPVRSGLLSNWPGMFGRILRLASLLLFRDTVQGAQSIVYCAVVSHKTVVDQLCGKLVADCRGVDVLPAARKYRDAERLWAAALRICALDDARTMATDPAAVTTD